MLSRSRGPAPKLHRPGFRVLIVLAVDLGCATESRGLATRAAMITVLGPIMAAPDLTCAALRPLFSSAKRNRTTTATKTHWQGGTRAEGAHMDGA